MPKICVREIFYGSYTYGYSVYNGGQVYDVVFNDYEGLSHSPSGVSYDPNSPELSSGATVIECRTYGISSVRYVPIQKKPIVGRNLLNCNNETGVLTFKSYQRIGAICLEKGCDPDSCKVDCPNIEDGFCCINHSLTDRLLQVLQN